MNFAKLSSSVIAVASLVLWGTCADAAETGPPASPGPKPTARPAAADVAPRFVRFVSADAGTTGDATQTVRGAAEFGLTLFGTPTRRFIEIESQRFPSAPDVPRSDLAIRSGLYGIGHTYLATSLLTHGKVDGSASFRTSFGIGLEHLPDPSRPLAYYADGYYYPEMHGDLVNAAGTRLEVRYKVLVYEGGLVAALPRSPLFFKLGLAGNRYINKQRGPDPATHAALTIGLGGHF